MSLLDVLHGLFAFLSTTEGALAKICVELVLFTILTYMCLSEFSRSGRNEHKFLVLGFGTMTLVKMFGAYVLGAVVFTKASQDLWTLNTVENFAEIAALFLVANAFVYPLIKRQHKDTKKFMLKNGSIILGTGLVLSLAFLSLLDLRGGSLSDFWTNTSITVGEILVLLFYTGYILRSGINGLRYGSSIALAMLIYAITPAIELVNITFYDNMNPSLLVAAQPFPFLSVLVFTQVIYLKLSDKAKILDRLRTSEKMYEHEKELSKLKDGFISTVSHELKTPITSMKLYLGLLKEKKFGNVTPKQSGALNIVNQECDRLNGLITDILDLSKFDAKKHKLDLSEFDLREIVDDKIYLSMAQKKKVHIDMMVPKRFIVVADRNRIKQVFINLFSNALKFTPEGGRITISAEDHETEWELAVQDTGIGIDKKDVPKLFSRFYQAEDVMTRKQSGFGLGLAIVKSIVELHKGKMTVDSEIGQGTRIAAVFPKTSVY